MPSRSNSQGTRAIVASENESMSEKRNVFWENDAPPEWDLDWGVDEFCMWATFQVDDVVQKMRWIAGGEFSMGSPKDEDDRWEDEGPQHRVTISQGFWLFDTLCTQELYQAVMDDNPSEFKGEKRPVESVDWEMAQKFIERLNSKLSGLNIRLPTEAEWEYSCRARTLEARYGELENVAWYQDNSGGETHAVKQKTPNAWGLYDTLGNVYEWCLDGKREYNSKEQTDPGLSGKNSANRVIRGGSWNNSAQNARAAYRNANHPSNRNNNLGFRCLSSARRQQTSS